MCGLGVLELQAGQRSLDEPRTHKGKRMRFWRREAPAPPPAPPTSNTELGFLLDPSVSQLILALYQQVTESGGHFFVEVRSRASGLAQHARAAD